MEQSDDLYCYRFLSDESIQMYGKSVKTPYEIQAMEYYGLAYQVVEYTVKVNLKAEWKYLPESIRRDRWEW
jgi:hypothetical protein